MSNRLTQIQTFLKDSPQDPFLHFALAKEYEKSGDTEKALTQYLYLTEKHENYVGTYYHLGKLYEVKQDFPTAFNTYKKGMEIAKAQGEQHAFNELAGAKLNLGDEEDFG